MDARGGHGSAPDGYLDAGETDLARDLRGPGRRPLAADRGCGGFGIDFDVGAAGNRPAPAVVR
ncbi:hypothetical protein PACID_33820 [Acidipropionibacterium acidipropionici ATCC 4875]|uniref:Uncharacterized protein n=1 Tax=Acidipropionibacterium acidipropionici (strain ATCC 4875 / DSM 20272 / JCM 6432 / NBRC 12425 / NCIMB 8070 / 4) TaxID=1171373 RepID=K7S168_ACIA4|nr:hypothetical protein PACID_33820 [Acidipropionibacterium acidipropionici ATCC 4875]